MVRVAGLKGQIRSGVTAASQDGLTPAEQIARIGAEAAALAADQQRRWTELKGDILENGIVLAEPGELTDNEAAWLAEYFVGYLFPVVTPLAVDPAHPFPFIPNFGFSIALKLSRKIDNRPLNALVRLPAKTDRFIRLPDFADTGGARFILVEQAVVMFTDRLFPGYKVEGKGAFRVIRDSDIEIEEEAEDLVRLFETALKRRRRGTVIRLEVESAMPEDLAQFVAEELDATEDDIFLVEGMLALNELSQLVALERPDLKFAPYNPRFRSASASMAATASRHPPEGHHRPPSVRIVRRRRAISAAGGPGPARHRGPADALPDVLRLAHCEGAGRGRGGRQVGDRPRRAEGAIRRGGEYPLGPRPRAGRVQVVFGFIELKTHAKLSMVVRREAGQLVTYCHVGTGNYHPVTAKVYTDLSFFTADPALGRDVNRVFNFITGYADR
jgi:polyphosphate kinase